MNKKYCYTYKRRKRARKNIPNKEIGKGCVVATNRKEATEKAKKGLKQKRHGKLLKMGYGKDTVW